MILKKQSCKTANEEVISQPAHFTAYNQKLIERRSGHFKHIFFCMQSVFSQFKK